MFTGIIEGMGRVISVSPQQSNLEVKISAPFIDELKVDQSIAHNGVCLTVDELGGEHYGVTIIQESLEKSNLGALKKGDLINLERCMLASDRFDGHIVQGHVDTVAQCTNIEDRKGSINYDFDYDALSGMTVLKGSITINGISLTVVKSSPGNFSVSIIPYTLENTNLKHLRIGDEVNIEFDIVGKYIQAIHQEQVNQ